MGEISVLVEPSPSWATGPDWASNLERAGRRWAERHGVKAADNGELVATWGSTAYCPHVLGHDSTAGPAGDRRLLRRSHGRRVALRGMRELGIRLLLCGLIAERWGGFYIDPDLSGRCPTCRR